MDRPSSRLLRVVLLAGIAAGLASCNSIREAAGSAKQPPDEFAIVTKAPLIIPPDYNLRPPAPGTAPANQVDPTTAAQQALFTGADPATVASTTPGNASQGEKLLLAYAGAQNANPTVRQDVTADGKAMQGASDEFTNQVLYYKKPAAPAAGSATASTAQTDKPDDADKDKEKKKSGGWFDWF